MTDRSPSPESPVQCAQDQAKLDLLNETLREIKAPRCDLECPEAVLVITRGGPVSARIDRRAGILSQFFDLLIIDPRTSD